METAIIETANYASHQSDRWLFVALLVLCILACGWMVKYFTGQIKEANTRAEKAFGDFNLHLQTANLKLTEVVANHSESLARYSEALDANTKVIADVIKGAK
jgi:hypothetical protein